MAGWDEDKECAECSKELKKPTKWFDPDYYLWFCSKKCYQHHYEDGVSKPKERG
jgi:hypothetical protein